MAKKVYLEVWVMDSEDPESNGTTFYAQEGLSWMIGTQQIDGLNDIKVVDPFEAGEVIELEGLKQFTSEPSVTDRVERLSAQGFTVDDIIQLNTQGLV